MHTSFVTDAPRRANSIHRTAAYSAAHLLVDMCCIILMLSTGGFGLRDFILYNFCAFAMQAPFGLVTDMLKRSSLVAALGCVLTGSAFAFTSVPILPVVLAGLGNALFHVGGGADVLHRSGKRAASLGVFVAPGAIGLFLGRLLVPLRLVPVLPAALMAVCAVALLFICKGDVTFLRSDVPPVSLAALKEPRALVCAVCLFLVVVLRSWVGMLFGFSWSTGVLAAVTVLCVALGKAAGGFLSDKTGSLAAGALTLGLSAVLFVFSDNAVAGLIAVLLFQCSMPVTLFEASQLMPGAKGFSFGLLTLALFTGYVLSLCVPLAGSAWVYAVGAASSLALIAAGLIIIRKPRAC